MCPLSTIRDLIQELPSSLIQTYQNNIYYSGEWGPLKNFPKRKEKHRCLQFKTKTSLCLPISVWLSELWIPSSPSLTPGWCLWNLVVLDLHDLGLLLVSQNWRPFNSFELLAISRTWKNKELISKFIPIPRK